MTSGAVERWVVNASPVILLGKAGIIHLMPGAAKSARVGAAGPSRFPAWLPRVPRRAS